ncbi:hypothetical protein QOT17_002973 [Balamuthia mandrillaris]
MADNEKAQELLARKFELIFNSATMMLGFESFVISSYLNSYTFEEDLVFKATESWSVLLIMFSLITNMLISVIAAHMSGMEAYQLWHRRLLLTTLQWICGVSLVVFVVAMNLIVADAKPLREGYKVAIYTITAACFVLVLVYYVIAHAAERHGGMSALLNSLCGGESAPQRPAAHKKVDEDDDDL